MTGGTGGSSSSSYSTISSTATIVCLILVLFFRIFRVVGFVTTTFNYCQFWIQESSSQINVLLSIGLKFKPNGVFIQRSSRINFLFVGHQDIVNYMNPPQVSQKQPRNIGTKDCLTWSKRNVCKNVSPRPTDLIYKLCWNDYAGLHPMRKLSYALCSFQLPATST